MKIENTSVLNQAKRICKVLKPRGDSWSAEHSATCLIRAVLEEIGETELLNSSDKLDIETRAALVKLAKPFMTASKNYQDSYLADAENKGDDGTPLMPKTAKGEKAATAEFA